jgi:hypothetical protein
MKRIDSSRIEELLQDESRAYRSIASECGVSDWLVRRIARQLNGDSRPMKNARRTPDNDSDEPLGLGGWAVLAGLGAAIVGAIWLGMRRPPGDGPS